MRYSIATIALFVAIHEASAAPCTSTSTSTAVETISLTAPPAAWIPSSSSIKSSMPKAPSSSVGPTSPTVKLAAPLHPQPPASDFASKFLAEHQAGEMVASEDAAMIPTITMTTTVTRCPRNTPMPYPQMTNQNSIVAPLSSTPTTPQQMSSVRPTSHPPTTQQQQMSAVGPTSRSPRPSRPFPTSTQTPTPTPTPTAKYITTSILKFIPQTSVVTSHIMPTPQCVLITPSAESISVQTVSQLFSRWVTTVVPEGQERLWQHFGGSGANDIGGSNENFVYRSSSAWSRHYIVRAGQTYEITDNSVPTMF